MHHDLVEQDRTFTRLNLAWYGKIVTLLGRIKETIVIIDYPGPLPYTTAGGLLFGNFINASVDEFDLRIPFPPYNRYSDMLVDPGGKLMKEKNLVPLNPAIRALIINYCSKGFPCVSFAQQLPTLVVGPQADFLRSCEQNSTFMDYALEAENLKKAVDMARRFARTENILVFDGAIAGFNVSEPLAEEMRTAGSGCFPRSGSEPHAHVAPATGPAVAPFRDKFAYANYREFPPNENSRLLNRLLK